MANEKTIPKERGNMTIQERLREPGCCVGKPCARTTGNWDAEPDDACLMKEAADRIDTLTAENARLTRLLDLYRDAVRVDPVMEGPRFAGSNQSALKRAWDADCAALTPTDTQGKRE